MSNNEENVRILVGCWTLVMGSLAVMLMLGLVRYVWRLA